MSEHFGSNYQNLLAGIREQCRAHDELMREFAADKAEAEALAAARAACARQIARRAAPPPAPAVLDEQFLTEALGIAFGEFAIEQRERLRGDILDALRPLRDEVAMLRTSIVAVRDQNAALRDRLNALERGTDGSKSITTLPRLASRRGEPA
jgi:hypothetical protein